MNYLTTKEIAEAWEVKIRQVQYLCENGKIKGAKRFNKCGMIPAGTPKPADGRTRAMKQKGQPQSGNPDKEAKH